MAGWIGTVIESQINHKIKKMEFINLKRQQELIKDELNSRISKVLSHGQYIMGPEINELEDEHQGGFWKTLQVQDQVVKYLSTNKYIKYKAAVDFPKGYKRGDY